MNFRFIFILLFVISFFISCGSPIIDGYTDKISYDVGDSLVVFINSENSQKEFQLSLSDINSLQVSEYNVNLSPQKVNEDRPYKNGFNYSSNLTTVVPELKSGIYLFDNQIPFVVKPKKNPEILIVYSSNTENAYSDSGGKSAYSYNSSDNTPSPILSFQRPIGIAYHSSEFLKWIQTQSQYDIGYICDQDLDDYEAINGSKLIILPGHSEYWTLEARRNFDRFIDEGNNALILSGNTMWWQIRYSDDKTKFICYKNSSTDPISDPLRKTVTWPDTSLHYSVLNSIGVDFRNGGFGKDEDNGWDGFKITSETSPILKGANLTNGDILSLPTDEYDGAILKLSQDSSHVSLVNTHSFHQYELIGYDFASRLPNSNAAWIAMQRSSNSGVIINTSSTDWCNKTGMKGKESQTVKTITLQMIDLLLSPDKDACFSTTTK